MLNIDHLEPVCSEKEQFKRKTRMYKLTQNISRLLKLKKMKGGSGQGIKLEGTR